MAAGYKRSDFPKGEPCFKMKRGYLWRFNDCGYTNDVSEAQLYDREEALNYSFGPKGRKNGARWGRDTPTYAIPVRAHLKSLGITYEEIEKKIETLRNLQKYTEKARGEG